MKTKSIHRMVAVCLSILLGFGALPDARAAADEERSLYTMSASAFFELDRANSPIEMSDIDYQLLAAAVFHETNQQRAKQNLAALEPLRPLREAAEMHSKTMAQNETVFHVAPDGSDPLDRVKKVGLDPGFLAENVASTFGIQYQSGEMVYTFEEEGERKFSYSMGGPPIPNHTYLSFARSLVDNWMRSPEHRDNILSEKAEYLGNGFAHKKDESGMDKFYCTQLFFARKSI